MREIPLTQGQVALVDDEDFERVNQFKWCAHKATHGPFYAQRAFYEGGKSKMQKMHHFIYGRKTRLDHKNGIGLDNRKENLRPASALQNAQSARKKRAGVSSQFRGVSKCWQTKQWRAQISVGGRILFLGRFGLDEEAAARAYDKAAREHFKEFASPNFPNEQS